MNKRKKSKVGLKALIVALIATLAFSGSAFSAFAAPQESADVESLFANNLEYYIPFDGDSRDIKGSTPTPNSVTYETGKYGQAARFNQRASRVKLSRVQLPADYSFSVSMWVKDKHTDGDPVLFGNKSWTSGANPGFVFSTRKNENDIRFNVNTSGKTRVDYNTNKSIVDDKWHLFTASVNRQSGVVDMYIDGTRAGGGDISSFAGQVFTANSYPLTIGNDGTGNYRDGTPDFLIDEFFLFNCGISADEAKALYEADATYIDKYNARVFKTGNGLSVEKDATAVLPVKENLIGDSSVTYEISDTSIISIDPDTCEVTGLKMGEAVITAKRTGFVDDKIAVTVVNPASVNFSIDKAFVAKAVALGQTGTATLAENDAEGTVEWESSNTGVLTIDQSGKYEAVAEGKATITARAVSGGNVQAQDSVEVTVRAAIPFRFRLLGAESATVDTPFLVNVHFDTGAVDQRVSRIEAVFSYDPAVLSFTNHRASGATYTDDPAKGELKAVYEVSKSNFNLSDLQTASRIGTFCFKLKADAPKDTLSTEISVKEVKPESEGIDTSLFAVTNRDLTIKTSFDPAADLNGDGLVSVGDVAKGSNGAAIVADGKFGFYPVKRVIYLGVDGGGNYLAPEGYIETGNLLNLIYTYGAKTTDAKYHFDMFEGAGGLAETGSYTWNAQTSNPPISGQNWTAMIYGYEPSDSAEFTIINDDAGSKYYPVETSPYKSIFSLLRDAQPNRKQSTFIEWGSMENGIIANNTGAYQYRGTSEDNINQVIGMIDRGELLNSSFTFIDTDHLMDGVGHSTGWYNDTYYAAGLTLANKIEQLVNTLDANEEIKDDTVFMIGNDHGGYGTGHGNWRASEYYVMMYSRGPIIKSGFKYDSDKGTQGNRGDDDARMKDWPALFAKAMNVEGCSEWVGTTDNHDIFLAQADVSQKNRDVEKVTLVKKDNGYLAELSDIQSGNEDKINAAHLIFSGTVDESALTPQRGSQIVSTFVKDGKTNVVVKTDDAYAEGDFLTLASDDEATLENVMLAKDSGREIYPDLAAKTESGRIKASVSFTGPATAIKGDDVEYKVGLGNIKNGGTVQVSLSYDPAKFEPKGATALGGKYAVLAANHNAQGKALITLWAQNPGVDIGSAEEDVLKIKFEAKAEGEAYVRIDKIKAAYYVFGDSGDIETTRQSEFGNFPDGGIKVDTEVSVPFDPYDFNRDTEVDLADLTFAQAYYQVSEGHVKWGTASERGIDVNGDKTVDLADFITILNHINSL